MPLAQAAQPRELRRAPGAVRIGSQLGKSLVEFRVVNPNISLDERADCLAALDQVAQELGDATVQRCVGGRRRIPEQVVDPMKESRRVFLG